MRHLSAQGAGSCGNRLHIIVIAHIITGLSSMVGHSMWMCLLFVHDSDGLPSEELRCVDVVQSDCCYDARWCCRSVHHLSNVVLKWPCDNFVSHHTCADGFVDDLCQEGSLIKYRCARKCNTQWWHHKLNDESLYCINKVINVNWWIASSFDVHCKWQCLFVHMCIFNFNACAIHGVINGIR